MQGALTQFEEAVRELDKVAPAKRIVQALEAPTRRAVPTFGTKKAMEAAKRFDEGIERSANAALSTPVTSPATSQGAPTILSAIVRDADADETSAPEPATTPVVDLTGTPTGHAQSADEPTADDLHSRRQHDADDEFASLLMQP
jgi:hypothetical protein